VLSVKGEKPGPFLQSQFIKGPAVHREFEKKFFLVAPVGNVPCVSGEKATFGSGKSGFDEISGLAIM
jgi:hypothetical protein